MYCKIGTWEHDSTEAQTGYRFAERYFTLLRSLDTDRAQVLTVRTAVAG